MRGMEELLLRRKLSLEPARFRAIVVRIGRAIGAYEDVEAVKNYSYRRER